MVLQAELEALESCLEEEQASLRQQKDQQERTAASVSGQMCLESQVRVTLHAHRHTHTHRHTPAQYIK